MTYRLAALLLASLPAGARADWSHTGSGVSLPDAVGEMAKGDTRDLSDGAALDVMVQYGSTPEPVTLYVYRGAYPNPALWFDRTRIAMRSNVGAFDEAAPPTAFTLAGAATPNGLREEYTLPGTPWKATSVAIAQVGEWMVKARVTSQTLDKAGVAKKMDRLLAALRFARRAGATNPLIVPGPCPLEPVAMPGKPKAGSAMVAAAGVVGLVAVSQAHGGTTGLAANPAAWCRATFAAGGTALTVYRPRQGTGWTALLGDAGIAVSAYGMAGGAVFLNRNGPALLAATYDAVPDFETGLTAAMPLLSGRTKPLAAIGVTP